MRMAYLYSKVSFLRGMFYNIRLICILLNRRDTHEYWIDGSSLCFMTASVVYAVLEEILVYDNFITFHTCARHI